MEGWANTRSTPKAGSADVGGLLKGVPVLWTPELKALWAPVVPLPSSFQRAIWAEDKELKLHNLRLSAGAARLHWCPQAASEALGVPLPLALSADGVTIEISPVLDEPL